MNNEAKKGKSIEVWYKVLQNKLSVVKGKYSKLKKGYKKKAWCIYNLKEELEELKTAYETSKFVKEELGKKFYD